MATILTHIELPVEIEYTMYEGAIDSFEVFLGHDEQTGNLAVRLNNLLDKNQLKQVEDEIEEDLKQR